MALQINRKYDNLPGLDSAPDIYETPELTDDNSTTIGLARSDSYSSSTKDYEFAETDLSGISRSRLPIQEARSHFAPVIVDAQNVDFSDRVTAKRKSYKVSSRRLKKYGNDTDVYGDLSDEDEDESFGRKLARLKREIEEIKEYRRKKTDENFAGQDDVESFETNVCALSKALNEISTQEITGKQFISKNLSKDLAIGIKSDTQSYQSGSTAEPTTFTVTYAPTYEQSHALAKVADFDRRLTLLEKALGISSMEDSSTSVLGTQNAILPSLEKLQRQVSLLSETTPSTLISMSRQIRNLTQEAEKLEDARKAAKVDQTALNTQEDTAPEITEDSELARKIDALYRKLPTIEKLRPLLPSLLDRLHSLRTIHADAASTKFVLDQIDKEQVQMAEDIKKWKEGLSKMETTIMETQSASDSNFSTIKQWIETLEEKVKSL